VRRWIHRYNQDGVAGLVDRPRPGRPRLGSPKLGDRIRWLLTQPKAWGIARLYQRLGRPALSLRTLRRRVSEVATWRRPRLVAKGDPDRDVVLAELHQQLAELPAGTVVLAEDETHVNLLPWVRATWIPHGQRHLHRLLRATPGRLPHDAGGRGDLRQRDHPPLQDRAALAGQAPQAAGAARGALQPTRQPRRADLGRAQGAAGQQPD
jgi:Homeodomain-like domain